MLTQIQKNWIHVLVWMGMLIYVALAPKMYTRFFLKDGKPVPFDHALPQPSKQISYSLDRLDPAIFHGQNLYDLWGWSFIKKQSDQSVYERYIVLQSDNHTYFFPAAKTARPEVSRLYSDLQLGPNIGFSAYISEDVIERGTYRIGLLFMNRADGDIDYTLTNKRLVKTANMLQLFIP